MSKPADQPRELALSGIRILELGHTVIGPSCSVVRADLGADVIKVEPPEGFSCGSLCKARRARRDRPILEESGFSKTEIDRLVRDRIVIAG